MKKSIVIVALLGLVAASAFGQSYWKGPDSEAAIIIRYAGSPTNGPYAAVTGTNVFLYEGAGTTNSVSLTNTASVIVGTINAFTGVGSSTNAYVRPWKALLWASTGTETCGPNKIPVVTSNNLYECLWDDDTLVWDTSVVDHYDNVLSYMLGDTIMAPEGDLSNIYGSIPGTGTCTIVVYENTTENYRRAFPAVTGWYYGAATNVVPTTTEGDIPVAGIPLGINLRNGSVMWIRGSIDVSSGSTGGIGASVE